MPQDVGRFYVRLWFMKIVLYGQASRTGGEVQQNGTILDLKVLSFLKYNILTLYIQSTQNPKQKCSIEPTKFAISI